MLSGIFSNNLDIVYFIYGLAFFFMGVAILVYPRRGSILMLADIIWLLALFGIIHGVNEWLDLVFVIQKFPPAYLAVLRLIILFISYIFLFEFGRRLINLTFAKRFFNGWLTICISSLTLILILVSENGRGIWPRYLLCFPGGLMTAYGFIAYCNGSECVLGPQNIKRYCYIAAAAVFIYGILGGLIVPKAPFPLAAVINNDSFFRLAGIPVQFFRASCAILLAWSIWNILGIFNWEMNRNLKNSLEQANAASSYLDNVITSMADSLIVSGPDGRIKFINNSTSEFLGYSERELIGMPVVNIFAEQEIEEILNELGETAFLLSKDYKIIEANNIFLEKSGMTKNEVIGQYCYSVTHHSDRICELPNDRCPVKEGELSAEMHTHLDIDGNKRLVTVIAAPIKNQAGQVVYYLHLSRDVKGIKKEGDLLLDPQDIKILTEKLENYVHKLELKEALSKGESGRIRKIHGVKNLDMYYQTKSNERIPVSFSASAITGKDGGMLGVVCVGRDMREIRQLREKEKEIAVARATVMAEHSHAEEIEELYSELEKSYSELKSAQANLIQAEKMRVVGTLAAGIAHEVKNPLAIVLQGIDYLSGRLPKEDKNIETTLSFMDEAVERACSIIQDLLDFSGISKLYFAPGDINSIIEKSISLVKYQLDKNRIRLAEEFAQDIPGVEMDNNRMEQVFVNLFINAINAMPDGGELKIKTYTRLSEEGKLITIEIEDTGIGIPEEAMPKIFEPFFTTRRDMGGTGLGLLIVRNIVELHNGKIAVENRPEGRGVKVILDFKTYRKEGD
jgi:PAS domain S-box-containing protein